MTPEMMEVRERLFRDFRFYAANALKIRTKPDADGLSAIAPLRLNEAQSRLQALIDRQLAATKKVRIIILKGRQMGLSTHVGGWFYHRVSQRKAQKAMVIAHTGDSTKTLFDMTRRFHDNMPEILKPSTRYSSRKEIVFDKLDSSYMIVTAGGDAVGRSETITCAHLSELAYWPKNSAADTYSGLMDSIPSGPGTAVIIESTANGISGLFYEQCQKARTGESDFEFIFLPWFIDQGYRMPVRENFSLTPTEEKLVAKHGLDNEQLMFRRSRIAEKGVELFKQEYPCDADEAFLTSGRPVFNPERLVEMREKVLPPISRMALTAGEWEEHPLGELKQFYEIDPKGSYYLGCDVGFGVRKDHSVIQVMDGKRRQAAVWRSDRVDPDYLGTVLAAVGTLYNCADIICERNGPGILTNRVLAKDETYIGSIFRETVYDKTADVETEHLGFMTTEKSKALVINELRARLRNRELTLHDATTLDEMQSFVVTESGKLEAEKGTHDDCVIALSLADHINAGDFEPLVNDDAYSDIE
ncbi:MAG: hypothetical protein V4457_12810 [Pseudomonadota bacterium]